MNRILLPGLPPSVNAIYGMNKGKGQDRYLKPAARLWKRDVGILFLKQKAKKIPKPDLISLKVIYYTKNHRVMDIDNRWKSLKDGLTGFAWDDDSQIYKECAIRIIDKGNLEKTIVEWEKYDESTYKTRRTEPYNRTGKAHKESFSS